MAGRSAEFIENRGQIMDTKQAQFEEALKAMLLALPEGKRAQMMTFRANVGSLDTSAGVVHALLISDGAEDLARAVQIIDKGLVASNRSPGIMDRFVRNSS
jgi:hypothetical protein